ncbi:MAG TPA: serine protease [Longimicrobiales bacterium]|nr:serine protease [Longimicrobiales bacterium]
MFPTGLAAGQEAAPDRLVRERYEAIASSVICIRTVVERELAMVNPVSGLMGTIRSPVAIQGTGVVIDTVMANGRKEYLILTNAHVADPSRYLNLRGKFVTELKGKDRPVPVPHESFVVDSWEDDQPGDDIRLVEIARDPAADMALLETVHAPRELSVFPGVIGYPENGVPPGGRVITSGFTVGGDRMITAEGTLTDLFYLHRLGQAHIDFSTDLPLEPGQSGSPVFLVLESRKDGVRAVDFYLIGLLHARQSDAHLLVPYALWASTLVAAPRGGRREGALADPVRH